MRPTRPSPPVRLAAGLALLVARCAAFQSGPPDVSDILHDADRAILALRALGYDAECTVQSEASDARTRWTGKIVTRIVSQRPTDGDGRIVFSHPLHMQYTVATDFDRRPREYSIISDGQRGVWIDLSQRRFRRGRLPAEQARLIQPGEPLLLHEFFLREPLATAQRAELSKYLGRKRIGGVDCEIVQLNESGDHGETRWFFGVADHLPRRVERRPGPGRGPTTILELSNLTSEPQIDAGTFLPRPPDGCAEEGGALLAHGSAAPDWKLSTSEGLQRQLSDQRGNTVVLMFWAAWNPASRALLPEIEELQQRLRGSGVRFFGISIWDEDDGAAARRAAAEAGATFGLLRGTESVLRAYRVSVAPTIYVLDRDGRIVFAASRTTPELLRDLSDAVAAAAPEPAAPLPE